MLNIFKSRNVIEADFNEKVQRKIIEEQQKIMREEDEILAQINLKKDTFLREFSSVYEEKLKRLSLEEIKLIAERCLTEFPLYMKSMGYDLLEGNIEVGKRVIGRMIGDLSDTMHNLPGELFTPFDVDNFKNEFLFLLEFLYVYEELQPSNLNSAFVYLKSVFPEGFIVSVSPK